MSRTSYRHAELNIGATGLIKYRSNWRTHRSDGLCELTRNRAQPQPTPLSIHVPEGSNIKTRRYGKSQVNWSDILRLESGREFKGRAATGKK
jgi:hypothetical protein